MWTPADSPYYFISLSANQSSLLSLSCRDQDTMAEQDLTPEQLAAIAAANEEAESSVNYKPPAQKSLQEIQELDKDDESLRKYKEALLGNAATIAG